MKRGQINVTTNTQTAFMKMVERKLAKSAILPAFSYYEASDYLKKTLVENLAVTRDAEEQLLYQKQLKAICDVFGVLPNQFVRQAQQLAMKNAELTCQLDELVELKTLLSYQREDEIDEESISLIDKMVGDINFVLSIANVVE